MRACAIKLILFLLCITQLAAYGQSGNQPLSFQDFLITSASGARRSPEDLVERALLLLQVPYASGTLIGGPQQQETFVARCDSLDCMLLLELVLAAGDSILTADSLKAQRYDNRKCAWEHRLHFFSDWLERGPRLLDAGATIPGSQAVLRSINCKSDGTRWLQGVPCSKRTLHRVVVNRSTLPYLRHGDLLGFWSNLDGLDVTHVGLLVIEDDTPFLLHASSRAGAVVMEPLFEYPNLERGLLVLRLPEGWN